MNLSRASKGQVGMTKLGDAVGEPKFKDGRWVGAVDIWRDGQYRRHKVATPNRTQAIRELAELNRRRETGENKPIWSGIVGLPMDDSRRRIPVICPSCGKAETIGRNGVGSYHSGKWVAVCNAYGTRMVNRWMIRKQRNHWFAVPLGDDAGEYIAETWRDAVDYAIAHTKT